MDTPLNAESSSPPKYSDFTAILGCVFLSIVMTGGIVITTRAVLNLVGMY